MRAPMKYDHFRQLYGERARHISQFARDHVRTHLKGHARTVAEELESTATV